MKHLVYRCTDCDRTEISRDMEGRRCNKCSGHLMPEREATNNEVRLHLEEKKRIERVANIKVTLALQPWFSVLQDEIVKAVKVAADAGMPEKLAYEIACYSVERAVKDAVKKNFRYFEKSVDFSALHSNKAFVEFWGRPPL